jgi:hypothetical protein
MSDPVAFIAERGDLAHFALFSWASSVTSLLVWTVRELVRANRRFNDFVAEIARLNSSLGGYR